MKRVTNQRADPLNDERIVVVVDFEICLKKFSPFVTQSREIASHHPRVKTPYPVMTTSGVAARSRKSKMRGVGTIGPLVFRARAVTAKARTV
jgi:hypothetical protein